MKFNEDFDSLNSEKAIGSQLQRFDKIMQRESNAVSSGLVRVMRNTLSIADRAQYDISVMATKTTSAVEKALESQIRQGIEASSKTGKYLVDRTIFLTKQLLDADVKEANAITSELKEIRKQSGSLSGMDRRAVRGLSGAALGNISGIGDTNILKAAIMENIPRMEDFVENILGGGFLGKTAGSFIRLRKERKQRRVALKAQMAALKADEAALETNKTVDDIAKDIHIISDSLVLSKEELNEQKRREDRTEELLEGILKNTSPDGEYSVSGRGARGDGVDGGSPLKLAGLPSILEILGGAFATGKITKFLTSILTSTGKIAIKTAKAILFASGISAAGVGKKIIRYAAAGAKGALGPLVSAILTIPELIDIWGPDSDKSTNDKIIETGGVAGKLAGAAIGFKVGAKLGAFAGPKGALILGSILGATGFILGEKPAEEITRSILEGFQEILNVWKAPPTGTRTAPIQAPGSSIRDTFRMDGQQSFRALEGPRPSSYYDLPPGEFDDRLRLRGFNLPASDTSSNAGRIIENARAALIQGQNIGRASEISSMVTALNNTVNSSVNQIITPNIRTRNDHNTLERIELGRMAFA